MVRVSFHVFRKTVIAGQIALRVDDSRDPRGLPLRGSDGEQTPLTRHTLEVMRAAILELDS